LRIELAGEEHFHLARQVLAAGGARRRLSMYSGTAAEKASRNDPSIIKHDELVAAQQVRKISEEPVL
jgi:hypothetical protein